MEEGHFEGSVAWRFFIPAIPKAFLLIFTVVFDLFANCG